MLPLVLERAFATGEVLRADGTATALHSNVRVDEAARLYDVVRALGPSATIEIGLGHGISALAITQALHDNGSGALHHIVDPFQRSYEGIGLANLDRAGLGEHVRFYETFPEEALPTLPTAEFAFIDASHLFDYTVLDFVVVDKRLEVGGVIGFHDLWMSSQQKVLRYILTNRSYRIYEDVAPMPASARSKRRSQLSAIARRVPQAGRLFRPEVLEPTEDLGIRERMGFIEKTGEDEREWRFHRQF